MTDNDITKLIAEKMMGKSKAAVDIWLDGGFSPLTDDEDAFLVVDKMIGDGFTFSLISGGYASKSWEATFYGVDEYSEQLVYEAIHPSRCKAICIAALRAVGVEVE